MIHPDGPCRHCGQFSWRSDEFGPVHECCDIAVRNSRGPHERCPCPIRQR